MACFLARHPRQCGIEVTKGGQKRMKPASKTYEVFICHRRNDAAALSMAIHRYLNEHGVATFCDLVDDPASELGMSVYALIRATPVFLLVLSDGVVASLSEEASWVTLELQCALDCARKL